MPPPFSRLHAVRRLDVAVDVDRLVEVEAAVRAPAERVDDVVRVLGAEAGEDDAASCRPCRPGLRRGQVEQLGAVGDVGAAVAGLDAGGDEQAVGEDGRLVGLAVAVGVFEDEDLVVRLLARLDLRVDLARRDPEPALRVEVHLDRLGEQRVGGEEVDLEPRRDDERLALELRVGVGDLGVRAGRRRPRGRGRASRASDEVAHGEGQVDGCGEPRSVSDA